VNIFSVKTGKPVDGPDAQVVSDLDAMVAERVAFRLHGKVHYINPISVKEFFAYTNALVQIQALEKVDSVDANHVVDLYCALIQSVCQTVSRQDVKEMTQAQAGALIQLISDCVTGRAHAKNSDEKKNLKAKSSLRSILRSLLRTLSPKRVFSSTGRLNTA
jgi:hypothetical protein